MGDNSIEAAGLTIENIETDWNAQIEALFRSQSVSLITVLTRLTGNAGEAEDIVQETFLKLYRRRSKLKNPGGWLYRGAVRLGLNAIRNRGRRNRLNMSTPKSESPRSSPDIQLLYQEQQQLARVVLGRMRERLAQVLILRYSGLSFAELAEIVGVRASSVGTLLNRAEKDFEKRYLQLSKGERPWVSDRLCI